MLKNYLNKDVSDRFRRIHSHYDFDNFDKQHYEELWARENPMRYAMDNMDVFYSHGTPPHLSRLPWTGIIIFGLIFGLMCGAV